MIDFNQAVLQFIQWMLSEYEISPEDMLHDDEVLIECEQVFTEHFETLHHEELISEATLDEAYRAEATGVINLIRTRLSIMGGGFN